MTNKIEEILRNLGVTKCYKGLDQSVYSIDLAVTDEDRMGAITKEIYMETAAHFGCSWFSVERNIRTVAARAWRVNKPLLCQIAGYPMAVQPSASEFIEIIASYILRIQEEEKEGAIR